MVRLSISIAFLPRATSHASSATERPLRVDIERIERMARRHEQAVAAQSAETKIGAALGQRDLADPLALRAEDHHAVLSLTHAPAAPQVAIDIAAEAVRRLIRLAGNEGARIGELVVEHVIEADHPRRDSGLEEVHLLFVWREAKP